MVNLYLAFIISGTKSARWDAVRWTPNNKRLVKFYWKFSVKFSHIAPGGWHVEYFFNLKIKRVLNLSQRRFICSGKMQNKILFKQRYCDENKYLYHCMSTYNLDLWTILFFQASLCILPNNFDQRSWFWHLDFKHAKHIDFFFSAWLVV